LSFLVGTFAIAFLKILVCFLTSFSTSTKDSILIDVYNRLRHEQKNMAEPTLQQVFGSGATQDATTLTILKSDLQTVGLTLTVDTAAEKLITAILKLAAMTLTSTNRDSNIDQSVLVDVDNSPAFATRVNGNTNMTYIRSTITVELDKAYSSTGINPDDY
jgi:hypothetical protein